MTLTIHPSKRILRAGVPHGTRAVKRMEHLTATAKGFEKYHPRLVASDGLRVSVIEKLQEQKSSFAFWKSPKNYTEAWLNYGR